MAKEKKEKKDNKSFLKEFKAELKRVSWPTFKQLVNNTIAVLTIVLITAAIVFVLDVIFENLNKYGIDGLKSLVSSNSQEADENSEEDISDNAEIENQEETSGENEVKDETGQDILEDENVVTDESSNQVQE